MQVELRAIDSIRPYDKNPRLNDAAVDAVAKSITEYQFRQPIVVDADGVIIVGHTRWKAAKKLGLAQVPVHVADLPPEKARAYRLADNQTATIAEWDLELLPAELMDLKDLGVDINALGWSADELADIMNPSGEGSVANADDCPAVAPEAVTRPGDLWVLGDHRLLCGSSTVAADVARVLDGSKAALCATDPPYLVDYTGERPDHDGGNHGGKDWSATYREVDITDADGFFRALFTNVLSALEPNAAIYCWHAHKRCGLIQKVWADLGILDHQQIVWVKPTSVFGRVFWHFQHEPCMMGWVQGNKPAFDGDHSISSVWEIDWEGKARIVGNEHPTQKPVELFARPIRKHTKRGEICFEPFCGSGSQLIAAESLGRRCCAMELEPVFVDVAVRRWQSATGREVVLDGTDRTWRQLKADRIGASDTATDCGLRCSAAASREPATEKTPTVAGVGGER